MTRFTLMAFAALSIPCSALAQGPVRQKLSPEEAQVRAQIKTKLDAYAAAIKAKDGNALSAWEQANMTPDWTETLLDGKRKTRKERIKEASQLAKQIPSLPSKTIAPYLYYLDSFNMKDNTAVTVFAEEHVSIVVDSQGKHGKKGTEYFQKVINRTSRAWVKSGSDWKAKADVDLKPTYFLNGRPAKAPMS